MLPLRPAAACAELAPAARDAQIAARRERLWLPETNWPRHRELHREIDQIAALPRAATGFYRVRLAFAWVLIWPAFALYYLVNAIDLLSLFVCCGGFRLLLGPAPPVSNCVLWAGWKWIAASWGDWRRGVPPGIAPGGGYVKRWSAFGPFWHAGWTPAPDMLAFAPPTHVKRKFPPPLFFGRVERGD